MPFTMSGSVQTGLRLVDGSAELSDRLSVQTSLASGTGANQANTYWAGTFTIPAGDDETINLLSLAVAAFGATGNTGFASVKHLAIRNQSANVILTVGPGVTDGWDQIGETVLGKSGLFVVHSPVAGLATTGTSKTITIASTDSVTTLDGDTTSGSATVSGISSTSALAAGMTVTGAGIPAGAKIASITNGTSLVMTASATATSGSGGESLDFAWPDASVAVYIAGIID